MRGRLVLLALAAGNLALAIAAWTRQPWANGPAAWRWEYLPAGAAQTGWGAGGGAAALTMLAGLGGIGIVWGHRRLAARRGALPIAVACGLAFTFGLVSMQPGGFARVTGALVSRNSFGFVWDAALAPSSRALLADYPAASAGLNQHSLTHPPGPLLVVRALDSLDRLLPAPAAAAARRAAGPQAPPPATGGKVPRVRATPGGLPALAAEAIEREVELARNHGRPVPEPPPGPWSVAALAVLLPALSALAAWPLYLLALRWGYAPPAALLAALLWLLVPARTLFTPSLDQALPALLAGAACLAAARGRWRSAAAGALLFAACFLSYGCLPALPVVIACAAAARPLRQASSDDDAGELSAGGDAGGTSSGGSPDDDFSASQASDSYRLGQPLLMAQGWRCWVALALGFAVPYLALAAAAGHDPWHALRSALALHHRIAVEPRSYATWLVWNPYDFALLLSPAVLGLAAAAALVLSGARRLAVWTWWALLAVLLLSGGVRGEVGRIWLVWMPFACLFAAGAATRWSGPRRSGQASERGGGLAPALVLATAAILILALAGSMVFVS